MAFAFPLRPTRSRTSLEQFQEKLEAWAQTPIWAVHVGTLQEGLSTALKPYGISTTSWEPQQRARVLQPKGIPVQLWQTWVSELAMDTELPPLKVQLSLIITWPKDGVRVQNSAMLLLTAQSWPEPPLFQLPVLLDVLDWDAMAACDMDAALLQWLLPASLGNTLNQVAEAVLNEFRP